MLVACLVLAAPAAAQEETALIAPADLYRDPEGAPLVSLPAGASVETGRARDGWHEAVVEGWIFTASTARTRRDGYDLVVTAGDGENLRASPNGPIVGRAREGTLLERVAQRGRWTHVRRSGWLPRQAVADRSPGRRVQILDVAGQGIALAYESIKMWIAGHRVIPTRSWWQ